MTQEIYFLSVFHEYVSMIIRGEKKWEFRENPRFGRYENGEIQVGDILFLVSTFKNSEQHSAINCVCRIADIRREKKMEEYFLDEESGHWKEAGCSEDSERNWDFFKNNILNEYSTAIRLKAYPVKPAIKTTEIKHKTKGIPWKGTGFTPAKNLKRFSIGDEEVYAYFQELADMLCKDRSACD